MDLVSRDLDPLRWWHMSLSNWIQCTKSTRPNSDPFSLDPFFSNYKKKNKNKQTNRALEHIWSRSDIGSSSLWPETRPNRNQAWLPKIWLTRKIESVIRSVFWVSGWTIFKNIYIASCSYSFTNLFQEAQILNAEVHKRKLLLSKDIMTPRNIFQIGFT